MQLNRSYGTVAIRGLNSPVQTQLELFQPAMVAVDVLDIIDTFFCLAGLQLNKSVSVGFGETDVGVIRSK